MRVIITFALVGLLSPTVATGQEPKAYVGTGFMVSSQTSTPKHGSPDRSAPGVGGTAIGMVVSGGAFLSPRLSVSAELSQPARVETVQEFHYSFSQRSDNQHRDLIVSGLLHVHYSLGRRLHPEVVAGMGVVREDTLQRVAEQIGPPSPSASTFKPYGPTREILRTTWGFTAGADLPIQLNGRIALLPQVRLHRISRADDGTASWDLDLSPFVFRVAVGVRLEF